MAPCVIAAVCAHPNPVSETQRPMHAYLSGATLCTAGALLDEHLKERLSHVGQGVWPCLRAPSVTATTL